jgi:hypothetical protein
MTDADFIWDVRAFVYAWFAEHTRAPDVADIAQHFDISPYQAGEALGALHEKHALFLEPGTVDIRMANPFSAIPTSFIVKAQGKSYWANCAWDCFGIVAALHAPQASIESVCAASGDRLHLEISAGQVSSAGEVVHFLLPFRRWYDDLVAT